MKREKWLEYERRKAQLARKKLTPAQYDRELRKIVRELKI